MSDQSYEIDGEPLGITGDGDLKDGCITVVLKTERAKLTLEFDVESGNEADALLAAAPEAAEQVIDAIAAAQEADDA